MTIQTIKRYTSYLSGKFEIWYICVSS